MPQPTPTRTARRILVTNLSVNTGRSTPRGTRFLLGPPGDLIRAEPSRIALDPAGHGKYSGTGTRIMYHSTDGRGQPVAVSGMYFEPNNPCPGRGPRAR
jgi:hypothetical protein